jgi:hypothetical protein
MNVTVWSQSESENWREETFMQNRIDKAIAHSEHVTRILQAIKKDGRKATRYQRESRRKVVIHEATRIFAYVLPKKLSNAS